MIPKRTHNQHDIQRLEQSLEVHVVQVVWNELTNIAAGRPKEDVVITTI